MSSSSPLPHSTCHSTEVGKGLHLRSVVVIIKLLLIFRDPLLLT